MLSIAVSVDGFIASVDTLIMGRNTFETVLSFPEWPYDKIPVIVLSSQPLVIPASLQEKVSQGYGAPETITAQLSTDGRKHLYIDGGLTIQGCLNAGLIDEIPLTRFPVLLGSGISLFGDRGSEFELRVIGSGLSDNGFVQTR